MALTLDRAAVAGMERIRRDPVAFIRDWLGADLWEKQIEIAEAVRDHRRVAVKSCHASGKCVTLDSLIPLIDGRVVPAACLVGRAFVVPAFSEDGRQIPSIAWATDNGVQPVFRVETECGRVIDRTGNHPLFAGRITRNRRERMTPEPIGWVSVEQLRPGDVVLVPERLDVQGSRPRPEDEVKLAGYLLGDGGTTVRVSFSQKPGPIRDEFAEIVERLGGRVVSSGQYGLNVVGAEEGGQLTAGHNPVLTLVREWGLLGKKATEKQFPDWAWELPNEQLALLLNRLFACDGWAYVRPNPRRPGQKGEHGQIGFTSASERLLRDVELALLRLGIPGRVRRRTMNLNGKQFSAWEWSITRPEAIERFAAVVGIYGKEDAVERVLQWSRRVDRNRLTKWRHVNAPEGYRWERVRTIEPLGEHPTVCISVPQHHTFVTTFVEHNSFLAARIVLWFLHAYPGSVVITTAPTANQVENILWRELRSAFASARRPLLGRCLTTRLDIAPDWYALGFKAADTEPDRFQGFHASHILVVIDEAAGVAETVYQALDAVMTSENARMLLIGNPTSVSGKFYEAFHSARDLYHCITIAAHDTPNIRAGKTIRPYLITEQWITDAITEHGEDSPYVQSRVHAEFPRVGENSLIPLAWIETAHHREVHDLTGPLEAGLDVARMGGDRNALCIRLGPKVIAEYAWGGVDTMETVGRVRSILENYPPMDAIKVDVIGVGAGVADRLTELGYPVVPVNVAAAPTDSEQFKNLRCELWWNLRERFREGQIAGPFSETTMGQLASIRYRYDSRHTKPVIEEKDEMRKRGLKSPDEAEAVLLAFASLPTPPPPTMVGIDADVRAVYGPRRR